MKRRSWCAVSSVLFIGTLCLVVGALAAALLYLIPGRAEQVFGPPTPQLETWQHIYLSVRLLLDESQLFAPRDPKGVARPFRVVWGESADSILQRLYSEGLIGNPPALRRYLQYSGLDTGLQAGDYQLSPAMTPVEIAHILQDPTPAEVPFHILPGWRLEEIAAALPTSGLEFSAQAFLAAARHPGDHYAVSSYLPAGASIEGFLLPDQYTLSRKITPQEFIRIASDRFLEQLTPEMLEGFARQGLDLYQAVTLASILQREAVDAEEMPLIASVFLNRLRANMKLDSDPTVQYALGYNSALSTWWTNPLSLEDLKLDSPYNTYLYPGLPPGPIANPGIPALQAVAFPADTPYYYFRAACDGSGRHVFARNFAEHIRNACP